MPADALGMKEASGGTGNGEERGFVASSLLRLGSSGSLELGASLSTPHYQEGDRHPGGNEKKGGIWVDESGVDPFPRQGECERIGVRLGLGEVEGEVKEAAPEKKQKGSVSLFPPEEARDREAEADDSRGGVKGVDEPMSLGPQDVDGSCEEVG